jgi:hypothetical protein
MPWYSSVRERLSQCCTRSFWTKDSKRHFKEAGFIGASGLLTLIIVLVLRSENHLPESAAADDFVYTLPVLVMIAITAGVLIRQAQNDAARDAYQQIQNRPGGL